jgi:ppGpp synthetase/RelA/SpoT-type nucleotidyltranferase
MANEGLSQMTSPSYLDIEQALRKLRGGRRVVLKCLIDHLVSGNVCAEPFLALSRFFCRLKSADSIVEKLKRKGIQGGRASEIVNRMPDILGFRVIVANSHELSAMDEFIRSRFEILSQQDRTRVPGEFGERGVEYNARFYADGGTYPFELQLRTFLQHYWAMQSFHLFHKKPRESAIGLSGPLLEFSKALIQAEECADRIASDRTLEGATATLIPCLKPLFERVHLVVIEPGEQFAEHLIHSLSGDNDTDHEGIVSKKMELYSAFPGAAIVECFCANFLTFHFNEPLVRVPLDRFAKARL